MFESCQILLAEFELSTEKKALIQPFLNVHTYNLHHRFSKNLAFLLNMLFVTPKPGSYSRIFCGTVNS